MLAARRVDGLIVTGRRVEPRPPVAAGPGIPVVYAMTQPLDEDGPAVLPDDEGGGRAAAEHLLAAGRRRIGHITGPERFLAARKRAAGFGAALAAAGLRPHGGVRFGEWSERWGREAAGELLADLPGTDAIFCGSDQIARGVADTLRAAGRHTRRRRAGRLRQLGADGARRSAAADQRRHVPGGGRPGAAELLLAAIAASPPAACVPSPAAWSCVSPAGDPLRGGQFTGVPRGGRGDRHDRVRGAVHRPAALQASVVSRAGW